MSKQKTLHVVLRNEGWVVRKEGNSRAVSTHSTQREAIKAARKIARSNHGELIIHGKDGRIADRNSYSSDPLPAKSALKVLFHLTLDNKNKIALQDAVKAALPKTARRFSEVEPYGKDSAAKNIRKTHSSSIHGTKSAAVVGAKEFLRKQDDELLIQGRQGQRASRSGSKSRSAKH